jgi:hypothetical protein
VVAPFRISELRESRIGDVLAMWKQIDFTPSYQRQTDLWALGKQQLFIDSLVNGYDIPKLYFHDLSWKHGKKSYAIIDGKQRLEAIRAFSESDFSLSDDFEDVERYGQVDSGRAAGCDYDELARKHLELKSRFDRVKLPIVVVETEDEEFIEEMFTRLNEALPLNAPEKRNALGGPLPRQIRRLARSPFFVEKLAFANARYKHLDLATKFLYVEHRDGVTDLKKKDLDSFVKVFKRRNWVKKAGELFRRSALVLDNMSAVFADDDPLLESVGTITIYYILFRDAFAEGWLPRITRAGLAAFEDERAHNRAIVREAQELALEGKKPSRRANLALVAFERWVQSPNDIKALTGRYKILRYFLEQERLPASEPDV